MSAKKRIGGIENMANNKNNNGGNGKVNAYEVVKAFILKARTERSKGVHCVYAKFKGYNLNQYLKAVYTDKQPKDILDELVKDSKIVTIPCKGGCMVYLHNEAPANSKGEVTQDALKALLS